MELDHKGCEKNNFNFSSGIFCLLVVTKKNKNKKVLKTCLKCHLEDTSCPKVTACFLMFDDWMSFCFVLF